MMRSFGIYIGFPSKCMLLARSYIATGLSDESAELSKQICKIIMSSQKAGLEAVLDERGIRISTEIVEDVLKRSENAGMLSYRFFEWAGKQRNYTHSVKAYHAMIVSLAKIRQYKIMWDLVNTMRSKSLVNVETFCIIMRRYARSQKVDEALYTFNIMEKYNVPQNLAAFNGLLSALCKTKYVRKAQEMFDKLREKFVPDSKTYSILIEGWGREPNLPRAREIFREMVHAGCEPDSITYGIMVDILCKAGRIDEAVGIVKEMDQVCKPSSFIYSVLVHTYGIENRIEDAVDTFLEMEKNGVEADVAVYNSLISAFCKVHKVKNVYKVLDEMDSKGVTPNSRTCNIILNCLIGSGETDEAFMVFRRMIKVCEPDDDTYTIMIKMFCDKDDIKMAMKIWKYSRKRQFVPGMHTFSVLINGLCKKGDVSKACILLEDMIERGIRPAGVTFKRLRQLLIKEDREDVLKFLQEKIDLLVKEPMCD